MNNKNQTQGEYIVNDINRQESQNQDTATPFPQHVDIRPGDMDPSAQPHTGKPGTGVAGGYTSYQLSVFFQIYLCIVIVFNLLLLFFDGHESDLGFWQDWVRQLSQNGYKDFNGNYPPIFIHWLYLVGRIYDFFGFQVEVNLYLKFLTQLPIIFSHLILTGTMFGLLKKYSDNKVHFHATLLLTTFNPALLLIGPVWGQVDITPMIPLLFAILVSFSPRWRVLSLPLYALAMLTKFQMIAFAPVFGIIFFRHPRHHLIGAALAVLTIGIVFLPSIVAGNFISAFKLAYVNVIDQYGLSTMGAANIWILLTGNATPDHLVLFDLDPNSIAGLIFKAKHFGILLFFLVCLMVFIKGIYSLFKKDHERSQQSQLSETLFYAITCSAAFFTFLPAMHERYLLPAAIVSLAYYAVTPNRIFYALGFTFACAFNVVMALGIETNYIWPAISWVVLFIVGFNIFELLTKEKGRALAKDIGQRVIHTPYLSAWLLILLLPGMFIYLHQRNVLHHPSLKENQMLLTDIRPDFSRQDFGQLQINKNLSGKPLAMAGTRYATGLGTHANSQIDFTLPHNATNLSFIAGLDDSIESADVIFSVLGDGQLLWESPVIYGSERHLPETRIDVRGVKKIRLKVSALEKNHGDHANWANIVVEVER